MNDSERLSFAANVRPFFTSMDVAHMKGFGIDLSDRDSVAKHADAILQTVTSGSMPPSSSGEARWTDEMCATFKRWRDQGCPS